MWRVPHLERRWNSSTWLKQFMWMNGSRSLGLNSHVAWSDIISTKRLYDFASPLALGFLDLKRNVFSGFLPRAFFCKQRREQCDCCWCVTINTTVIIQIYKIHPQMYINSIQFQKWPFRTLRQLTDKKISSDLKVTFGNASNFGLEIPSSFLAASQWIG